MIRRGETTGDSAEYDLILQRLDALEAPPSAVADAVLHILKRLGRPDDEAALDQVFNQFESEHRVD